MFYKNLIPSAGQEIIMKNRKNKKQNLYVYAAIRSLFIFCFFIWAFTHNKNLASRLMLTPFMLCSLFSFAKNICFIRNKIKSADIFQKLFYISFLLFWFGLIGYAGYLFIANKVYIGLLFMVPFMLTGIYLVCKRVFHLKPEFINGTIVKKIPVFLVIGSLLIGISCLSYGIFRSNELYAGTKKYVTTVGYLTEYEKNTFDEEKNTYKLIYTYEVDGKEYKISTDYGVGIDFIPVLHSQREIKYEPDKPNNAILEGMNPYKFLIYFGTFFVLGASVFVISFLYVTGIFDKLSINIMELYLGIICIVIGFGMILFQKETSISLISAMRSLGIFMIIPIIFTLSGIYLFIKALKKNR